MGGCHKLAIIATFWLAYLAGSCVAQVQVCTQPFAYPVPIWLGENGTGPACAKGFYCPFIVENDNTTWPSVCPATINCTASRLSGDLCEAQGIYEPIVCPPGYYCPDFRTKSICPDGHFCPLGTVEPYVCEAVSECPEGSSQRRYWGALIIIAVVDVALGGALFAYLFTRIKKAQRHSKRFKLVEPSAGGDHGHTEALETVVQMKPAVAVLVDGFARSRGSSPPLDIFFEDLRLVLPKKNKTLLAGVSGSMKAGNMTAIMGPSGAGKTTFISTLMGKVNNSWNRSGTLSINGVETTCSAIKSSIGYVPQEDIMHRELTVWQNICYSADTRLPASWTREERYAYCESILEVLNLQSVKYQRIGNEEKRGISGGQRKRVNIAIELAAAPLILFLDEPTTGLDASAALEVCEILNKIVKLTNINVAVVIHQPRIEIWNALDNLLILAPGGKTVYLGPQKHVQDYFAKNLSLQFQAFENPADTLMDAISLNGSAYADKWRENGTTILSQLINNKKPPPVPPRQNKRFSKSVEVFDAYALNNGYNYQYGEGSQNMQEMNVNVETHIGDYSNFSLKAISKRTGASWIRQLVLSHVRSVKQQAVNYQSLLIEMALSTLAGILIGMSSTDTYQGVLKDNYALISPTPEEFVIPLKGLFINLAIGLAASAAGVRTFGDERVIYFRETASGHSPSAYYLGVSLSVLYRIFIMALHFAVLFYVVGMPMASLGHIYAICFGVYFAVYGLSAIISMVFKREDAPLTAVIATLVAAIMSGFINVFPIGLKAISYAFWSGEAFYSGEVNPFGNIYDLSIAKEVWDYDLERFDADIIAVVFYGIAYRMIAYVLMILLNRDKQK